MAELAGRQHGVVGRWQLLGLGFSERQIQRRAQTGRLLRIHQGVYAVGHIALTRRSRWTAAVLAGGAGAVLSHWSAAMLWGIWPLRSGLHHVTLSRQLSSRRGLCFHQASIPGDELRRRHGIPTTGPFRTVLDLAARASPAQLDGLLAELEAEEVTDNVSFSALLARHPGRRGAARLRAALDRAAELKGVTASELERRFIRFLKRYGLPMPEVNVGIHLEGRFAKVDCLWRSAGVAVELDGYGSHGDRRAFFADRARNRAVIAETRWRLIQVTAEDLRDRPDALAGEIRALLRLEPVRS